MHIELDFRSGTPIYIQIIDQIKNLIAIGQLQPGEQLPTVRQLATDLRVNFNTVARVYRLLDEEGVISTQHGRGTYILEPESVDMTENLRKETLDALTRRYFEDVDRLGVDVEDVESVFEQYLNDWRKNRES